MKRFIYTLTGASHGFVLLYIIIGIVFYIGIRHNEPIATGCATLVLSFYWIVNFIDYKRVKDYND